MSLNVWTEYSEYMLGETSSTENVFIQLPVVNPVGVSFNIISGSLPPGLSMGIVNNIPVISGIPFSTVQPIVYTFCVRASQGTLVSDRTFKIQVNSVTPPVFITDEGILPIGINNTLFAFEGSYIEFQLQATQPSYSNQGLVYTLHESTLPAGLSITESGFISGRLSNISTQISTTNFSIKVSNTFNDTIGDFAIVILKPSYVVVDNTECFVDSEVLTTDCVAVKPIEWITQPFLGYYVYDNYITLQFETVNSNDITYYLDDNPALPPGTLYNQALNIISGYIPQLPENRRTYEFSIIAVRQRENHQETLENKRDFFIDIVEKSSGVIKWLTDSDLGSINVETPSLLIIEAIGENSPEQMVYTLQSGDLPPGLHLNLDGTIEGKISSNLNLLTSFDEWSTAFDSLKTTFDRTFTFVVKATDQIKDTLTNIDIESGDRFGIGLKEFKLLVTQPMSVDETKYSNIVVTPLLNKDYRNIWRSFIYNHNIFRRDELYKADDDAFGVQTTLSMIVYAGLEVVQAEQFLNSMLLNHKPKRYQFGEILTAVAKDSAGQVQYEVVYINMIDPQGATGKTLPIKFQGSSNIDPSINFSWNSVTRIFEDDPPGPETNSYYPNSFTLWRQRLNHAESLENGTVVSNSTFIPLWMKTYQPTLKRFIGVSPVIPICFCKPGKSKIVLSRIQQYMTSTGFSLNMIDYTVDRYTVQLLLDDVSPRYFVFRNEPNTI